MSWESSLDLDSQANGTGRSGLSQPTVTFKCLTLEDISWDLYGHVGQTVTFLKLDVTNLSTNAAIPPTEIQQVLSLKNILEAEEQSSNSEFNLET